MDEIFFIIGLLFGIFFILYQYFHLKEIKKLEQRFTRNMLRAIEKMEWEEKWMI